MESVKDELVSTDSESKKVTGCCGGVKEISGTARCGQFIDWIRKDSFSLKAVLSACEKQIL